MRPTDNNFYSDLMRPRTFLRPLAMFVAVAIGGIGGASVILSLASPPAAERSSRVMIMDTAAVSPAPETEPHLASATPAATPVATPAGTMARTDGNATAPVETTRQFSAPARREAQNRKGHAAYWGKYRYRNFARYSAPRFSASW
jgi:hypothetical protein